jgi:hypothetical protein
MKATSDNLTIKQVSLYETVKFTLWLYHGTDKR